MNFFQLPSILTHVNYIKSILATRALDDNCRVYAKMYFCWYWSMNLCSQVRSTTSTNWPARRWTLWDCPTTMTPSCTTPGTLFPRYEIHSRIQQRIFFDTPGRFYFRARTWTPSCPWSTCRPKRGLKSASAFVSATVTCRRRICSTNARVSDKIHFLIKIRCFCGTIWVPIEFKIFDEFLIILYYKIATFTNLDQKSLLHDVQRKVLSK